MARKAFITSTITISFDFSATKTVNLFITYEMSASERSEEVPFFIVANGLGKGYGKFAVFLERSIPNVGIFG